MELRAALELIACGLPWLELGGTAPFMVNRSARVVDAQQGISSSNAETPPPFPSWGADAGADALTFAGSVYALSAGLRLAPDADLRSRSLAAGKPRRSAGTRLGSVA